MTTRSLNADLAVRLISSVAGHSRNQAAHIAAANAFRREENYDAADVRGAAAAREEELVTSRSAQLEGIIREQDARISALEDALKQVFRAHDAALPHGQYERYTDVYVSRAIADVKKRLGLL